MFRPFYFVIRSLLAVFTPILLVVTSISFMIGNAGVYKSSLKASDFYTKLSTEIRSQNINYSSDKTFQNFLVQTTIVDLASPGWLQHFFEKNIDQTTSWINGDLDNWVFYIPTTDIETVLANKLDNSTTSFNKEFGDKIPNCSDDQAKQIKREGFDLNADFCLPKEVKNGRTTLTNFLGVARNQNTDKSILSSIVKNNSLNTLSDNLNLQSTNLLNTAQATLVRNLNSFRDSFLIFRKALLTAWVLIFISFLGLALLSKLSGKNTLKELKIVFSAISTSTLLISATFILFLGGSSYLTATANSLLLPGMLTSKISSLVTWELVKISLILVSIAIFLAIFLIITNLLLTFAESKILFSWAMAKNAKLRKPEPKESIPTHNKTETFDEKFKSSIDTKQISNPSLNDQPIKSPVSEESNSANSFQIPETEIRTETIETSKPVELHHEFGDNFQDLGLNKNPEIIEDESRPLIETTSKPNNIKWF